MNRIKIAAVLAIAAIALAACGGGGDKDDKKVVIPAGTREACVAIRGEDIQSWQFSPLEKAVKNECWLVQQADNQ